MKKISVLLAISITLSSCATLSTLDPSATIDPAGDESIVVIGVRPEYMVALQNGPVLNSEFHPRTVMTEHFFLAPPKNNYLVAKIKANAEGEAVGVVGITAANSLWGKAPTYKPCNSISPVFTVPPGKAIYVGDVTYTQNGDILQLQTRQDFISARKFIDENYSNLKGKLTEAPFETLKVVGVSCNKAMFVPIYIPSGR